MASLALQVEVPKASTMATILSLPGGGAVEACPRGGPHGIGQNHNPAAGGAYVEGYVTPGDPHCNTCAWSASGQTDLWL
jgi:hypothetical protein